MENKAKLRPLYLAKILYEQTDEEHFLTTAQLMQILEQQYGIQSHRQTIKTDIELLKQFGLEIEEVKSTQNRYNLFARPFEIPELKLLIDAVCSSKFITASKSKELVVNVTTRRRRNPKGEGFFRLFFYCVGDGEESYCGNLNRIIKVGRLCPETGDRRREVLEFNFTIRDRKSTRLNSSH